MWLQRVESCPPVKPAGGVVRAEVPNHQPQNPRSLRSTQGGPHPGGSGQQRCWAGLCLQQVPRRCCCCSHSEGEGWEVGGGGAGGGLRRGRVWERGKQTPGRAGELQASGGPPEGDGHSGPHRGYNVRDEAKPRCVPAAAHEQRKAGLALPQEDAYSVVLLVVISVAMASCCLCPLALPHIGHVLSRITLL